MKKFDVGMKLYKPDWFLKYNLSYQEAARCLSDWGVTFVLVRDRLLPLPGSTSKSQNAGPGVGYSDRKLRDALASEGIEYWTTVRTFYEPRALDVDPSLRPVGSDGQPMERIDWYVGITPSMEKFVSHQTERIQRTVQDLEPDGVFLSFTRWPGFWELWMPHHSRQDFPDYSYDQHTLDRFERETGVNLFTRDPAKAISWIEANARQAWTTWKCQVIVDVIRQMKETCQKIRPGAQIMLNTLPFGADEFDGAQEKVFGQNIEALADVVDIFEVMTYHQILKRPTSWIPQAGEEVKLRSGRKTVCTIQARPIYLDGVYAKDNRSPTLDSVEFTEAVNSVSNSAVDGIVVFSWSDLLKDLFIHNDTRRIDAIRDSAIR